MKNKKYFGNRNNKQRKTGKRIIYIIAIMILVLIPAILALASYMIRSSNILGANAIQVSLYYDNQLVDEKSDDPKRTDADELVTIFHSIINQLKKAENVPDSFEGFISYEVKISSRSESNCYCLDSVGNVFILSDSSYDAFLASQYAQALYESANAPNMYSTSDEIIIPYSSSWYYKNVLGNYVKAAELPATNNISEYNMSGTLGLTFETPPDSCLIEIYKSGIEVYEGDLNGLSSFSVEAGTSLQFEVSAKWEEKSDRDFYGEVFYNFKVLVRDRAEFILDKITVERGDFIIANCTNVYDVSKIKFNSEPSLNCTPIFYEDNGIVRALLPFSKDLKSGEYKLAFSYGATVENIIVTLEETQAGKNYTVSDSNYSVFVDLISQEAINKKEEVLNLSFNNTSNSIYFRNKFLDYKALGAQVLTKYSTVISTDIDSVDHITEGTQYVWLDNNYPTVRALNSGKVISEGNCKYLGNYVIIDHGIGLKTVYAHMSMTFVQSGDIVNIGEEIGLGGALNKVSPSGVYIMCFIYDVAIDFEHLAGKEVSFYYNFMDLSKFLSQRQTITQFMDLLEKNYAKLKITY